MSSAGSDQYSDMSDSDADKKRRGLRRGQRQQVNYRETSESSDNSRASTKNFKVKGRGRPRKDHLSSDYSDGRSSPSHTDPVRLNWFLFLCDESTPAAHLNPSPFFSFFS